MDIKCKKMLSSLLCFFILPNLLGSANCFYAQKPFSDKSFVVFNETAENQRTVKVEPIIEGLAEDKERLIKLSSGVIKESSTYSRQESNTCNVTKTDNQFDESGTFEQVKPEEKYSNEIDSVTSEENTSCETEVSSNICFISEQKLKTLEENIAARLKNFRNFDAEIFEAEPEIFKDSIVIKPYNFIPPERKPTPPCYLVEAEPKRKPLRLLKKYSDGIESVRAILNRTRNAGLKTERLIITKIEDTDILPLAEQLYDDNITKYYFNDGNLRIIENFKYDSFERAYSDVYYRAKQNNESLVGSHDFAIKIKETNEPIGILGFDIEHNCYGELSFDINYFIGKNYQNRGYATEVTTAFTAGLFEGLTDAVFETTVHQQNESSKKVVKAIIDAIQKDSSAYYETNEVDINNLTKYTLKKFERK